MQWVHERPSSLKTLQMCYLSRRLRTWDFLLTSAFWAMYHRPTESGEHPRKIQKLHQVNEDVLSPFSMHFSWCYFEGICFTPISYPILLIVLYNVSLPATTYSFSLSSQNSSSICKASTEKGRSGTSLQYCMELLYGIYSMWWVYIRWYSVLCKLE